VHHGTVELGYATNLSFTGFCMRTRQIHPPGFKHAFTLSSDDKEAVVEARVHWTRQLQVESHVNSWHEMGLELAGPPSSDYLALLRKVESPPEERRIYRRFPHYMNVTVKKGKRSFEATSVDISQKGLLVVCEDPLGPGDNIVLGLQLPGTAEPVSIKAKVVRTIGGGPEEGHGFAVQFQGFSEGEERMFLNYLRIVKELHTLGLPSM
jgi:hypothetical protein